MTDPRIQPPPPALPAFTPARFVEPPRDVVYCCDALALLRSLPDASVNCIVTSPPYYEISPYYAIIEVYKYGGIDMPDELGRIQKGERLSPKTEFKKGEHWREEKPFWNYEWLHEEYVTKQRSSKEIADEFGVTDAAIIFWLKKLGIPRRTVKQARAIKHWGLFGEQNGMYGRTGEQNPHWLGGVTPERQSLYSSQEWIHAVRIVWKRDNRTCQRCGKYWTPKSESSMHIHHIVSFKVKHLRAAPDNLVLLCEDCHIWVHSKSNTNREFIKDS